MAGGKNKEFMADPIHFFNTYYFGIQGNAQPRGGLINIDIVDAKGGGVMLLVDYDQRTHGAGARPVPANYLPFIMDNTSVLALNPAAPYMFTADLSGCMFAAYGPDPRNVTVEHVNQRTAQAKVNIADRCDQIVSQQYGFCKIVCRSSVPGLPPQVQTYDENAAVFGLLTSSGWSFYLRSDPDQNTSILL